MGTGGYPVAPPFQLPVSIILHYMYESQRVIYCTHNSPFQLTEVRVSHDLTHRFILTFGKSVRNSGGDQDRCCPGYLHCDRVASLLILSMAI